ncbi:Gfo/Idh/MocA family oxidoreductase [Bacillus sp. REN3]|uniref:Gfo/Idh/MocA family protein n=1 Tax=Bacillus sp. REN3 TaxID=2802440 RepID=UPI001AEDDE6E
MKVGIMSFAHMHAYSYANCLKNLDGAELSAVFDDDEARGKRAGEQFGVPHLSDMDAFLNDDLDAVIICSENIFHKKMVLKAAAAKKHILCEKPLATTVEDAEAMIAACKENNVILQTAFPVRFSKGIRKLKKMIDHGELGKILAMRTTNRGQNPGGWFVDKGYSGGGAVLDHTVHMVDIMRWYLGKEIKEVYATIGHYFSDMDIDDAGLLTLEFEDGTIASHDTSWSRFSKYPAWGDATIEVIGTKKTVSVDAFGDQLRLYKQQSDQTMSFVYAGNDIDFGLIEDFVFTVKTGGRPSISGLDGLKAMEAALAAYKSAETGKSVILNHQ